VYPARKPGNILKSDASYIIIGGTGGIGLDLASWFLQQGAKHLILISRNGVKNGKALQTVQEITNNGARVEVCRCDISDMKDMEKQLVSVLQRPDVLPQRWSATTGNIQTAWHRLATYVFHNWHRYVVHNEEILVNNASNERGFPCMS
jgi:NAD(P)-dependent dehydrogenase (short-subunit alcohol dehydrogenase family)